MGGRIENALNNLPDNLLERSGSVFYSSRHAFLSHSKIYILGLNPGGDPANHEEHIIRRSLKKWREENEPWSAYTDEIWTGTVKGSSPMQLRLKHMMDILGSDLRLTPASNVVFLRTRNEAALEAEKDELLAACWPVHQAVIDDLNIKVILCFGGTAGNWTRQMLGAHEHVTSFEEKYEKRHWVSTAHKVKDGPTVVTLTHPSRANWINKLADPSTMVKEVLDSYS